MGECYWISLQRFSPCVEHLSSSLQAGDVERSWLNSRLGRQESAEKGFRGGKLEASLSGSFFCFSRMWTCFGRMFDNFKLRETRWKLKLATFLKILRDFSWIFRFWDGAKVQMVVKFERLFLFWLENRLCFAQYRNSSSEITQFLLITTLNPMKTDSIWSSTSISWDSRRATSTSACFSEFHFSRSFKHLKLSCRFSVLSAQPENIFVHLHKLSICFCSLMFAKTSVK